MSSDDYTARDAAHRYTLLSMTALRRLSLLNRKWRANKDRRRGLRRFDEWQRLGGRLPPPASCGKKLLLIRMDEIGDYLLFRNQLEFYKRSTRWQSYNVTLLGNDSWRELHAALDGGSVDEAIWIDKQKYFQSADYRLSIWRRLRESGFEVVIAPSRTRPLLIDDLCMLAASPTHAIGSANTFVHPSWNRLSDGFYTELFNPADDLIHEFRFNAHFTEWACGLQYSGSRPHIDPPCSRTISHPYLLCFVGANTRSKRWPVNRWVDFINLRRRHDSTHFVLAGAADVELQMARDIQKRTGVESIAGRVTLTELLPWVAGAHAVLTNDTMASHMSVSLDRPTVIIANGVNYLRFSEYRNAGIARVAAVYPDVFNRVRARIGESLYDYTKVTSTDIASIRPEAVFDTLEELLRTQA